jgi:hypothetical protein
MSTNGVSTNNTLNIPKLHAGHIEVAVAELLGWREHTIVPNVSWGPDLLAEKCLCSESHVLNIIRSVQKSQIKISQNGN